MQVEPEIPIGGARQGGCRAGFRRRGAGSRPVDARGMSPVCVAGISSVPRSGGYGGSHAVDRKPGADRAVARRAARASAPCGRPPPRPAPRVLAGDCIAGRTCCSAWRRAVDLSALFTAARGIRPSDACRGPSPPLADIPRHPVPPRPSPRAGERGAPPTCCLTPTPPIPADTIDQADIKRMPEVTGTESLPLRHGRPRRQQGPHLRRRPVDLPGLGRAGDRRVRRLLALARRRRGLGQLPDRQGSEPPARRAACRSRAGQTGPCGSGSFATVGLPDAEAVLSDDRAAAIGLPAGSGLLISAPSSDLRVADRDAASRLAPGVAVRPLQGTAGGTDLGPGPDERPVRRSGATAGGPRRCLRPRHCGRCLVVASGTASVGAVGTAPPRRRSGSSRSPRARSVRRTSTAPAARTRSTAPASPAGSSARSASGCHAPLTNSGWPGPHVSYARCPSRRHPGLGRRPVGAELRHPRRDLPRQRADDLGAAHRDHGRDLVGLHVRAARRRPGAALTDSDSPLP